jgi:hypothetical protein
MPGVATLSFRVVLEFYFSRMGIVTLSLSVAIPRLTSTRQQRL